MKKTILFLLAALALSVGFTSCDDDFERPPLVCDASGDGTAADPFNVLAAIWKAQQTGTTPTTQSYYIAGYVVEDPDGKYTGIDTSFGNASWLICATPEYSDENFVIYRCKDFEGKKFTDADKVKVGDYIVVYSQIVNYGGKTPETSGSPYLYSVNGDNGGQTPVEPVDPGTPEGDGTLANPFNCAAAVAKAIETGETATAQKYYIKGVVVAGGAGIDTSYGNATFNLADKADGASQFIAYRIYDIGGGKFTDANKVKEGDVIVIYANIVNYKGNTPETSAGGSLISINGEGSPDTPSTPSDPGTPEGDGTASSPFNCAAAVAKCIEAGTDGTADSYYVEGYAISGSIDNGTYGNATFKLADSADGEAVFTAFRFYDFGGEKFTNASKIKVGDKIVICGKLVNYMGNTPETSAGGSLISINGKTAADFDDSGDPDEPDEPVVPSGDYKGDFNSFNGGVAKSSPYGVYTNATGWTASSAIVLAGSDSGSDTNPYFTFIGSQSTMAPTIRGKVSDPGKIVSPVLAGGCNTLTFNYGFAFNENFGASFTVRVLQDGVEKASETVTLEKADLQKQHAYSFSFNPNVSGNFQIEIVNNCLGEQDSNVGRVSIWNLTWD